MQCLLAVLATCMSLSTTDTMLHLVAAPSDTVATYHPVAVVALSALDTVRKRPRAVEVDDNYELRLRIHRYASYATVPLFALQTVVGNQLYNNGGDGEGFTKAAHSAGAAALGALFTVNTVTGVWNLWSSRDQPEGRTKRILHSVLMLASDAGFTYTGVVSTDDTRNSASARTNHRNWAYASMGTALVGYGIMLIGNN